MENSRQPTDFPGCGNVESSGLTLPNQRSKGAGRLVRKTSAEIVSEAKSMLAGGGTRLVSARRPITPREPRRQLYGRLAPPGRPPSAINLKYLQQGPHALPSLEPIQSNGGSAVSSTSTRSESVDGISSIGLGRDGAGHSAPVLVGREKLPALVSIQQKVFGSLENVTVCDLPDSKSLKSSKKSVESNVGHGPANSIVKNHPLKRRQVQSLDDKIPTAISIVPERKNAFDDQSKLLRRSNDLLLHSSTESLLEMLKAYSGLKECDESTVTHISAILHELYVRVKDSKGSWRGAVLGALYGLVEASSSKILLLVASIVLAMNVTGSNLTGACKLVFKIARNENNDNLFMDSDVPELLVDGLGRASPIDDSEACIYGYGAVRFLTGSSNVSSTATTNGTEPGDYGSQRSLAVRLAKQGLCQLMVLHLKMINEIASTTQLSGSPLHALFQLSGALRTLAGNRCIVGSRVCQLSDQKHPQHFATNQPTHKEDEDHDLAQLEQAVPLLVRAAEMCIKEPEVQANIIRTLSVLSERAECCERLAVAASRLGILLGSIIQTCQTVEKGLATCNRLGYILGNVMSRWDTARIQFYCCDVSCDALLATLEYYANKSFTMKNQMGDSIVQVLTKLIRIVANMCVNGDVGYGMSKRSPLGEILLNILLKVKDAKTAELEELLFATLGALHNLSYYYEPVESDGTSHIHPGSIGERMKDICGALCVILNSDQNPARSEVARVLGNMTRNTSIRQTFCEENGMKILKRCLASQHDELMVTSCGVLVNMLGDWSSRVPFREIDGPIILRRLLQKGVDNRDWIMAGIACQAIWNYLIDTSDILITLGQTEIDLICEALAEGLDEDSLFDGKEPDNFWEDFAPVATDLLERLQMCMSNGNSPCESSDEEIG
ncbi:armadillo repeat-containing protein 2 [Anopheles maculipalpis]|uniref:armadillo repeat-containing protein 2 n=1 Tax=Anopheles maculipalpis TaxID=1496333 RepID=UPI00215983BA|nr:armadillo repeat-containing protein 2 [Anopheles maculipalpis]